MSRLSCSEYLLGPPQCFRSKVGIDDPHLILLNFLNLHLNLFKLLLQCSNLLEHFTVLPFKAVHPKFKGTSDCNVMGLAGLMHRCAPFVLGELIVLFPILAIPAIILMQNSPKLFIIHPLPIGWNKVITFGGSIIVTVGMCGHLMGIQYRCQSRADNKK